jgi:quinoprotein glucose dehydrogenase
MLKRAISVAVLLLLLVGGAGWLYLRTLLPEPLLAPKPAVALPPDPAAANSAWTRFAADAGATQYSPLSQITPQNVRKLRLVWTYRTGEATRHADELSRSAFAYTPILVAGSLIICTPWSRIIALDPASGRERWVFDPDMKLKQPGWQKYMCRGVTAWRDPVAPPDSPCAERIIFGTNDLRVMAVDARNGKRCPNFGSNGEVQVVTEKPQLFAGEVQFNSPPAIANGVVIFGSMVADGTRPDSPRGTVRAFDARSGAPKWQFEPIPTSASDPAWGSWQNDSALRHGSANVWADISVDEARDLVFLPTSSPAPDGDGRDRGGDNRNANSVVAVRGATGERVWSFQTSHHDLWDYDLPTAPLLTDLAVDGKTVSAAIQLTKQGLVFVLDRDTGQPIYPVEERAVGVSEFPGEVSAPTQPFPSTWLMAHWLRDGQKFTADDAWGFTFWDQGVCRRLLAGAQALGLYGPASSKGTIMYPWASGGNNMGSRAYDPRRRLLITSLIRTVGVIVRKQDGAQGLATRQFTGERSGLVTSPFGAPCLRPPWGELVALDVEQQKIVWRVPLGTIEKLAPVPLKLKLGTPMRGGPMLTGGGLVFIAGTMDDALRALDTETGEELWRVPLPAGGQATPMSYETGGQQYVVIAAGGHAWMQTTPGDYVIAYRLSD